MENNDMNKRPKVSVVAALPKKLFIKNFLEMVEKQDFNVSEIEIIVVVPSIQTKRITEINNDYVEENKQFASVQVYEYFKEYNLMEMVLHGIKYASGGFIIVSDEDFFRSEKFIQTGVAAIEKSGTDLAVMSLGILWGDGKSYVYDVGVKSLYS